MGSQLMSNAVRRFFSAMVLTGLLTGSVAEAASYQKTDGTIVDPILDRLGIAHFHSWPNLEPGADLESANLYSADLSNANLSDANLVDADLAGAELASANLTSANLYYADLKGADLKGADLTYAYLSRANLVNANLHNATLTDATLYYADMANANLTGVDLYGANLTDAYDVETSTGSPYYYGNTVLPAGFDPVAQGWTLSPYCDFIIDAACDLADINQMFQAGNLVTGVTTSDYPAFSWSIHRMDLVYSDTINAADITEWLAQAATANGHGSPYLRGDTELDRDVDITDFNVLASHFDPAGDGYPNNGPLWNEGNFDGDDDTDITDFNVLAVNFAPEGYGISTVPEPSTLLLTLLVLATIPLRVRCA